MDVAEEREAEQLHYWHIFQFLALGFERHQAEILELAGVDWREAEELLDRGASHEFVLFYLPERSTT